jgi:hypothetical protein
LILSARPKFARSLLRDARIVRPHARRLPSDFPKFVHILNRFEMRDGGNRTPGSLSPAGTRRGSSRFGVSMLLKLRDAQGGIIPVRAS